MTKGSPSKQIKKYKEKLKDILAFNHKCYQNLHSANSLAELETLFLRELDTRYELIEDYSDTLDFYDFKEFVLKNDIETSIKYVNSYFYYLENSSYYHEKNKLINTVSFQEALGGNFLNHRGTENLTKLFDYYDKIFQKEDYLITFEFTSWDELFHNSSNEIKIFNQIKKDLEEYLKNDKGLYNKFCLLEHGEIVDNAHNCYESEYIETYLNDEIFIDFNKTIKLLKKTNLFNTYKENLYTLLSRNNAELQLHSGIQKYDLAQFYYPNKIANIKFNMTLPLESLQEQLASIYNEMNNNYSCFNFINDYNFFTENFFQFGKKDTLRTKGKTKIEKNKISLISKLFIFDSKILLSDDSMIEDTLSEYFGDLNISPSNNHRLIDSSVSMIELADRAKQINKKDNKYKLWASGYSKSKYFKEILNLIKTRKYLEISTGIKLQDLQKI